MEAFGINLSNLKKGYLQDKTNNSETLLLDVIAPKKGALGIFPYSTSPILTSKDVSCIEE